MEIAGRLAAGIAHDFNNLLTIIAGRSQLLQARLGRQGPEAADVEAIVETAHRAAALTRQLLLFSRKEALVPQALSLDAVVTGTEKMLRRVIGEDVQLVTHIGDGVGHVMADPNQLEQLILNLAVNARDAMPTGGVLTLRTDMADADEARASGQVELAPGRYCTLSVTDTGAGIDADALPHIFEPFFTTKGEQGTGLGLSTVYGIVVQSGGGITVASAPGRGTTFRIYLPCVHEPAATPASRANAFRAPRGTETILIAEDDDAVRALTREILNGAGYAVLEGRDGAHALAVSGTHEESIHLLIADVVMPYLSGRELAERVQAARPETRVLFISGYTDEALTHHRVSRVQALLLDKPFGAESLLRSVRQALDALGSSPAAFAR